MRRRSIGWCCHPEERSDEGPIVLDCLPVVDGRSFATLRTTAACYRSAPLELVARFGLVALRTALAAKGRVATARAERVGRDALVLIEVRHLAIGRGARVLHSA